MVSLGGALGAAGGATLPLLLLVATAAAAAAILHLHTGGQKTQQLDQQDTLKMATTAPPHANTTILTVLHI